MKTKVIEANVNASIDIGKNITSILEKLADKIGTTVDKIFPWYIKQELYSSYISICVMIFVLFASGITMYKTNKNSDWNEASNINNWIVTISGIIFTITLLVFIFSITSNITTILNPEYAAMKRLFSDMEPFLKK